MKIIANGEPLYIISVQSPQTGVVRHLKIILNNKQCYSFGQSLEHVDNRGYNIYDDHFDLLCDRSDIRHGYDEERDIDFDTFEEEKEQNPEEKLRPNTIKRNHYVVAFSGNYQNHLSFLQMYTAPLLNPKDVLPQLEEPVQNEPVQQQEVPPQQEPAQA